MNIKEKKFSKTVRLPEHLNGKLEESITNKEIKAIWFDKTARTEYHILWLNVIDKKEILNQFPETYQNTILDESKILIVFLDKKDFEYSKSFDDFILAHLLCENNCLYATKKINMYTYLDESYLRKLKNSYEEKHLLLKKIGEEFIHERLQGAWQFMIKAFANDIVYLEYMLFGTSFENKTVTQRLLILESFIPEVKRLFVKKDEKNYFLIDYINNDDDSGYYDDFGKSLQKIQKLFYQLVHQNITRYTENYNDWPILNGRKTKEDFNDELMNHKALDHLKKFDEVEELFLFHQIPTFDNNHLHVHLYVFVVIKNRPTPNLTTFLQNIERQPIENVRVTAICYTQYQIQNELYEYQPFFKRVMKSSNKIYSYGYHPKIHWYNKKISYLDDLCMLLEQNLNVYNKQIKSIVDSLTTKNYLSSKVLVNVLANQLQLLIFSEVIFKPKTDNLLTLWNLMLFANSALLDKFSTTEVNQLIDLFQKLQNELVKDGQLLLDESTCGLIDKLITTCSSYIQSSNGFNN